MLYLADNFVMALNLSLNGEFTEQSDARKIKSRHFCRNSKCRLFCRPKMCYNVINREVLACLRR